MVIKAHSTVRPVSEADRQQLANLIHFETQVHRHLDWRSPLEWIGRSPYLIAERDGRLLAALACPPEPAGVAWVRLFAVSSEWSAQEAWQALWPAARSALQPRTPLHVAALPLQQWYHEVLAESNFQLAHQVVLLIWKAKTARPTRRQSEIVVRPMTMDDLPAVTELDNQAFDVLWQNDIEANQLAYQQSAVATIAEDENGLLGFQISTANPMGGHLARLAVQPNSQGKGVGYLLLDDVLDQFERRGITRMTVNTQHNNLVSLALYKKAGFETTGEAYPVYQYALE